MGSFVTLVLALLRVLPWERIVAVVLNRLVKKAAANPEKLVRYREAAARIQESALAANVVIGALGEVPEALDEAAADGEVTAEEGAAMCAEAIEAWAEAKQTPERFKSIWRESEAGEAGQ